jgi:hypothetical protein
MVIATIDRIEQSVKGEFHEMPGLRLTRAQLQRLYSLDSPTCDRLLNRLLTEHFLVPTAGGRFCRADECAGATR